MLAGSGLVPSGARVPSSASMAKLSTASGAERIEA
jgi:hypothetical protein